MLGKYLGSGVTKYTSRRTGKTFLLYHENGGQFLYGPDLHIWTKDRAEALRLLEMSDQR